MEIWQQNNQYYYKYAHYLKNRFGKKVFGVSLDAGFTCPNIDGTVARGGCVYCSNKAFVPAQPFRKKTITEQIEEQLPKIISRYEADEFFAYFQSATNTYAPIEKLRSLYNEALSHKNVIGIKVSTRPDCVSDEVLDLLAEFQEKTYVLLELGLQTIHEKTSKWINRAHASDVFFDAVERANSRNLEVCAHVILGLKDESTDDMLATADALAKIKIHGVKIHNLNVTKNTALAAQYAKGEIQIHDRIDMLNLICSFIERLHKETVIYRVLGETPKDLLIAPIWKQNKQTDLAELDTLFKRRGTTQGSKCIH